MGELKGILKFVGTVGNIRVYFNKTLKRYIVSAKGKTPKDVILNNPAFARQRENMSEFKCCSYWASLLRSVLFDLELLLCGYYFSGFMSLGKKIQKLDDVGNRGFRALESSKQAHLLSSLVFNNLHPFDMVCSQKIETWFSADRKRVTLTMAGFRSYSRLTWPTPIRTYRLALLIGQLSDFVWDVGDSCYKPVVAGLQDRSVVVYSDWKKTSTEPEDVVMTASFAEPALEQSGTTVVVVLAIEISAGNGEMNSVDPTGLGTMKIVECYV